MGVFSVFTLGIIGDGIGNGIGRFGWSFLGCRKLGVWIWVGVGFGVVNGPFLLCLRSVFAGFGFFLGAIRPLRLLRGG